MALGELLLEKSTTNTDLVINDNTLKQKMIEKGIPQDTLDKYDIYYDDGKAVVEEYVETRLELPADQTDWYYSGNTITGYGGNSEEVTIPYKIGDQEITTIGASAFASNNGMKKVVISEGIQNILQSAFSHSSIQKIIFSNTVNNIGSCAFQSCANLERITIPGSVTSIGNYAFTYCTELTSITIPNSVTSIGDGAFQNCTNLKSIVIPDSVTSIGEFIFLDDSLETATLGTGIGNMQTIPDDGIFNHCYNSVKNLNIRFNVPNNLKNILNGVATQNVENVVIESGVTSIAAGGFNGFKRIKTLTIPSTVTSVGNIFEGYYGDGSQLQTITIKGRTSLEGLSYAENWPNNTSYTSYTSAVVNGDLVYTKNP